MTTVLRIQGEDLKLEANLISVIIELVTEAGRKSQAGVCAIYYAKTILQY